MDYQALKAIISRGDPVEMEQALLTLWGYVEMTKRPARKPRAPREEGKPTWLTPIAEAYEAEMGAGTFIYGKAAPHMKALVDGGWSTEEIARRLRYYLRKKERADEIRFASFQNFRATFKDHDPDQPAFNE